MTEPDSNELTQITNSINPNVLGPEFKADQLLGGRYRVISLLGKGGMGVVYKVEQVFIGKELALKTIDKHFLSDIAIRRFQHEARASFAVDHPNIISVHDFGLLDDQTPFLVMEIATGETLAARLKKTGSLPIEEAIQIFIQVCFGLAHAHESGVVHRDIKPSNIMIDVSGSEGTVKILDFGIAKFTQHEGGEIQALTKTGEIFGSPLYMSPEQCSGGQVDFRSDIYSLGCVMFEALTGTAPFVGENALFTMMMHKSQAAPSLKEASLGSEYPVELERIIQTMLAKNPDDRYQTLGKAAHDLAAVGRGEATRFTSSPPNLSRPEPKTILMRSTHFYALLISIAIISASVAGILSVLILHMQSDENANATKTIEKSSINQAPVHFSRRVETGKDGIENIVFEFPEDRNLGYFIGRDGTKKLARGEVRFVKRDSIYFHPSESFLSDSNNLSVFQPNDLLFLDLKESISEERASQIMQQVARLTGLQSLDISENDINDEALEEVDNLPNLQTLIVNSTNIAGLSLSKLATLRRIQNLAFNNSRGTSDLLHALENNKRLSCLYVNSNRLTVSDFKAISTISGLRILGVNKTGMNNAELDLLKALTNLVGIEAEGCSLTKEAIPVLQDMSTNGLRKITLSTSALSPQDIADFKKTLPIAYFVDKSKSVRKNVSMGFVSDFQSHE